MSDKNESHAFSLSVKRRTILKGGAGLAAALSAQLLPQSVFAAEGLVALVHTQAAGDNGPVDSMIEYLKRLAAERGFTYRTIYALDPATYETVFRTLGNAGAEVVISTFNEVTEPFKALAPLYPDTKWLQLYGDPFEPSMPNVKTVSYDYHLGCYLSGKFGAKVSKTGKIGFVGGVSLPTLNADFNALKAGALSVNPNAEVTAAFAGSFQDPAKGQEIATQMYNDGIDYIQSDAAATDSGVIAAANEGEGRMVSAISPAQYALGPSSVVALAVLDFGRSLYNETETALGGGWVGGHSSTGLGTGVIDFVASPVFAEQGPSEISSKVAAVWAEIEEAKQAIIDGSLKVEFDPNL